MVFVDIKSAGNGIVVAEYRPEREDARPGVITYDVREKTMVGVDKSPDDDASLSWYVMGAIHEIRRMIAEMPIRMHGKNIWY